MVSPSSKFLAVSHFSSGEKYSCKAEASIFSCPVIAFITSGHGREDPIARPALYCMFYKCNGNFLLVIFKEKKYRTAYTYANREPAFLLL